MRGYHYNGAFKEVISARSDGLFGQVEWHYNWVTFMDAMLQIQILGTDSRTLLLPTKIRKLRINGVHHFDLMTKMDPENRIFDVYVDQKNDRIIAGGIELIGLHASPVQRRRPPGIPVLEKYLFIPYCSSALSIENATRVCVQLALENNPTLKMKIVEVDTNGKKSVINVFLESIEDLPVITGEYMLLTSQNLEEIPGVHIENGRLCTQSNCHFVICSGFEGDYNRDVIETSKKTLVDYGYLLVRETSIFNMNTSKISDQFRQISIIPIDNNDETFVLLQKVPKKLQIQPIVVEVSENDKDFEWISHIQTALTTKTPVIVYSFNEIFSGVLGFVNCLRKEPDGNLVRCVFIDDINAPAFDLSHPLYASQLSLGMAFNVFHNVRYEQFIFYIIIIPEYTYKVLLVIYILIQHQ